MATWVRTGNTLTGAADAVVTGTIELGNATAPADFDPDGVTSVRIQFTEEYASGTFDDDVYTANQWGLLTLDGAGATLADTGDQTNQTINDAADSFANLSFNELFRAATPGDGWVEIHNRGATPQDLTAILQAMESAGVLHAELEII